VKKSGVAIVLPSAGVEVGVNKRDESGSVDGKNTWKPLTSFIPFYNSFPEAESFFI